MPLKLTDSPDDRVFAILEAAAARGDRCPTNPGISVLLLEQHYQLAAGSVPTIMRRLTRAGRIIVRVYGNNWRDVSICVGPHAGKVTLPPPHGGKPHTVLDIGERSKRDAHPGKYYL